MKTIFLSFTQSISLWINLCTSNSSTISRAVTVSQKVESHASKCCKPFCARVSYCKHFWMEHISTIEFEIGIPVPRFPVISSRYRHFINKSLDFWASVWAMPHLGVEVQIFVKMFLIYKEPVYA